MMENATEQGYFRTCPTDKIPAVKNPSKSVPDFMEIEEFLLFMSMPPPPHIAETIESFIFVMYTGVDGVTLKS
jgi:hypothetical protein